VQIHGVPTQKKRRMRGVSRGGKRTRRQECLWGDAVYHCLAVKWLSRGRLTRGGIKCREIRQKERGRAAWRVPSLAPLGGFPVNGDLCRRGTREDVGRRRPLTYVSFGDRQVTKNLRNRGGSAQNGSSFFPSIERTVAMEREDTNVLEVTVALHGHAFSTRSCGIYSADPRQCSRVVPKRSPTDGLAPKSASGRLRFH